MPSMTVNKNIASVLRKSFLAAATAFAFIQCSDEEVISPAEATTATVAQASASSSLANSITSLTISGVNTTFATAADCKTCTYVVPAGSKVVDGKAIGLQPGSILCLNTLFNYGALELTNIEGTTENPIVIMTVGENVSEKEVTSVSESDSY
jgi:hypothetical protein